MRDRIFEHRFCETEVIIVAVLVALYCTFRNNALETFKWGDRILLKRRMCVCVCAMWYREIKRWCIEIFRWACKFFHMEIYEIKQKEEKRRRVGKHHFLI